MTQPLGMFSHYWTLILKISDKALNSKLLLTHEAKMSSENIKVETKKQWLHLKLALLLPYTGVLILEKNKDEKRTVWPSTCFCPILQKHCLVCAAI